MSSNEITNGTGPNISGDKPSVHPEGFQGFSEELAPTSGNDAFDLEPEFEEPAQSEPEVEASAEASDFEPEQAPEKQTPRAQKRIQQLANQKRDLESKNEELQALVEQLRKSNELQSKMQEKQDRYWEQQEVFSKQQSRQQLMRQYGLDPNDVRDNIAYEQMEYKAQLEQQLHNLQASIQEQQHTLQIERFNQALDSNIASHTKGYKVDPKVLQAIRDTAFDIASVKGLTASQAAEAAFERYKNVLPRLSKEVRAPNTVDKVVTMGNRSKSRAPDKDSKDADFLTMLESGNYRL